MYGDPGGQAAFAVGGRPPQPMNEVQPGTYQGQYTVHRGDDNPYAVVTGILRTMPDGEQEAIHAPRRSPYTASSPAGPLFPARPGRLPGSRLFQLQHLARQQHPAHLPGPARGSGFFNLGGQQIPVIEERPGFYYANYAPPPNYQPGVVPVLVSFQPRGGVPQEASMQRPITLMRQPAAGSTGLEPSDRPAVRPWPASAGAHDGRSRVPGHLQRGTAPECPHAGSQPGPV